MEQRSSKPDILKALSFLHPNLSRDYVVELYAADCHGYSSYWEDRALGLVRGWFSETDKLAGLASDLDYGWLNKGGYVKYASGLYVTMNPVHPNLRALGDNRLRFGKVRSADKDVEWYHNIMLDLDAKRLSGTSSSPEEKEASWIVAQQAKDFLTNTLFWPEPMVADSGNGYHLVFKAWFSNTPENVEALSIFLKLMDKYLCSGPIFVGNTQVQVCCDPVVFNPARLIKLHGTWARKGDSLPERPHRKSFVISLPYHNVAVTPDILRTAAAHLVGILGEEGEQIKDENTHTPQVIEPAVKNARRPGVEEMFSSVEEITPIMQGGQLDVQQYLNDNGYKVREVKDGPGEGTRLYVLERCLFDSSHGKRDASIGQQKDGLLFYKCFHASCTNDPQRGWPQARRIISGDASLGKWMSGGTFGVSFPHINQEGKPYERYENFKAMLRGYGIKTTYNLMKRQADIVLPGGMWETNERRLDGARALLAEKARMHGLTKNDNTMDKWLLLSTLENEYHPAKKYVLQQQWDGIDRLEALASTVHVPDDQVNMWHLYLRKWLIQGIAALFHPDFSGKGVLTFTGNQNVGKTSWLRRLVPTEMQAFGEGLHLDPKDKDTIINAMSHWIVELGELEGVFKMADIARLKAVLSNTTDKVRMPYGRESRTMKRQTIFAATVNDPQFLVDQTGNSRWWVVKTMYINWRHNIDMQQVWAQAMHLYMCGESWHLTEEESDEQFTLNAQYEVVDPLEEELLKWFKWGSLRVTWKNEMTATEVLKHIGTRDPKRSDTIKIARILAKYVGPSEARKVNGVTRRCFMLPETKTAFEAGSNDLLEKDAQIIPFKNK